MISDNKRIKYDDDVIEKLRTRETKIPEKRQKMPLQTMSRPKRMGGKRGEEEEGGGGEGRGRKEKGKERERGDIDREATRKTTPKKGQEIRRP